MIRKIFLTLWMASLSMQLVPFSGCTARDDSQNTLRFVSWKPNQPEVWDQVLGLFKKDFPDIRVEREIGPHSSSAFHDMLTQKLKNRSRDVDVFLMDVIWPSEFAAAGWALALDDLFPKDEQARFIDAAILANTYKGRIYGVPLFIDSGMLYYRKDLLARHGFDPPETWPELVYQAETIVTKERDAGHAMVGYSGQFKQYEGLVCNMMEFIMGHGGTFLDRKSGKSAVAGPRAVAAVRFVRDHIIGAVAPRGVLTYQEPESLDLFIQGKAVFHRNWPYAWEISNNPAKSRVSGKVGLRPLPGFNGNPGVATLGGWQVGISAFSEKKMAAWTFVRFLTSEKVQRMFAKGSGKAPTRQALYQDAAVIKANPHFRDMQAVFMTAYPRPVTPLYPAISNILQRYFSKAISSREWDIEKGAEAASGEMNRMLSMTQ